MTRRTRIALAGALLLAVPVVAFQLVQRGWRRDTASLLQGLEEQGLGASVAALGLDGPVAADADALARAARAVQGLPDDAAQYLGSSPAELESLLGPDPPDWFLVQDPETGERSAPKDSAANIRWILTRLQLIEPTLDAARGRPGRFPVDWSRGVRAELAHLIELKSLLGALQLRAGWRLREGDAAGAWLDVERMLALTARLDDPVMIGRLVRAAATMITTTTIVELVARGPPPPPDQRARLDAALAGLEDLDGFQRGLRGDLYMFLRTFELEGAAALEDYTDPKPMQRVQLWLTLDRLVREWAEVMGRMIRAAGRGTAAERHDALITVCTDVRANGSPNVNLFIGAVDRAFVKEVDALASARLARVALRLGATGLPAAAPDLLVDPWSGDPLLYARDPDGTARVWSVGSNRTDEGGAVAPPTAGGSASDVVIRLAPPR